MVEMPLSGGRTLATIRLVLGEHWLRWVDPNADVVALLASTLMSTTRDGDGPRSNCTNGRVAIR